MKLFKGRTGFTLIELLVVILILAILMAIALPLYLRAVRDSNRQSCRTNMQTIANALEAYKVRNVPHLYPAQTAMDTAIDMTAGTPPFLGVGAASDLSVVPQCPTDAAANDNDDYFATEALGQLTITCTSSDAAEALFHNTDRSALGFQVGADAE